MEAKYIDTNVYDMELRYSRSKKDTWDYTFHSPLGKRGYWFGHRNRHRYLGPVMNQEIVDIMTTPGFPEWKRV